MHVFWIKQYYYWHHRCCQKQFYIYISNELNPLRELFWKCLSQNSFEIIKIFFINWILQIVLSIIIKVVLYFHQKFSLNYIFSKTTFFLMFLCIKIQWQMPVLLKKITQQNSWILTILYIFILTKILRIFVWLKTREFW